MSSRGKTPKSPNRSNVRNESWILNVTRADSSDDLSVEERQPFDYRLNVPEPLSPKKASSLSAINTDYNDSDDEEFQRTANIRQSSSFREPKVSRTSMLGEIVHHVPSPTKAASNDSKKRSDKSVSNDSKKRSNKSVSNDPNKKTNNSTQKASDGEVKAKARAEARLAQPQAPPVVPGAFAIQSKAPAPKADSVTLPQPTLNRVNHTPAGNVTSQQASRGESLRSSTAAVEDALTNSKEKEKHRDAANPGTARTRSSAYKASKSSKKGADTAFASLSSPGAFRQAAAEAGVSPIKQKMLRELVYPSTASPRVYLEGAESGVITPGRSTLKEKMIREHARHGTARSSPGAFQSSADTPKSPLENKMMRNLVYPSLENISPKQSPGGSSLKEKMLREHLPPGSDLVAGQMELPMAEIDEPESGVEEEEDAVVAAYLAPSEIPRQVTTVTSKLKDTVAPDSPITTAPSISTNTRMTANDTVNGYSRDPETATGGGGDGSAAGEVVEAVTTRSVKQANVRRGHMIRIGMVLVLVGALALGFILSSKLAQSKKGDGSSADPGTSNEDGSPPSEGPPGTPGEIPSFAPTTARFQMIKEEVLLQFPDMTIEPGDASYDAVDWLANEDFYYFEYPLADALPADQLHFRQRFALATFFFSTGGRLGGYPAGTWKDPCNFMSSRHVCQWQCLLPPQLTPSLYALTKTTLMGVQCGQDFGIDRAFDDHVVSIELVQNGLTGKIPNEIEGVESLFFLNLYENSIQGSIPFNYLAKTLVNLIMPVNNIQGSIPEEPLKEFTKLRTLWLDWNQISGTLPSNMAAILPVLTVASFGNNLLEGPTPESFFQIEGIETVVLSHNMLTGTIPDMTLSKINSLDVQGNFIKGTLPQSISSLVDLFLISFLDNRLSGTIPTQIGGLTKLQFLGLSGNEMTGDPTSHDFLWQLTNLNSLFLGNNGFTGSLNDGIASLSNLQKFGVEQNEIVGTIPPVIGNLTDLEQLTLSYNQLSGSVPTELAQLTRLEILSIELNQLTGDLQLFCDASQTNGLFQANCMEEDLVCTCCTICCDDLGVCATPSLT